MSDCEPRTGATGHLRGHRGEILAGVRQRAETAVGEPVTAWVAVVETVSGREVVLFPPDQNPAVLADLLADGAHRMRCPGCEHCRH